MHHCFNFSVCFGLVWFVNSSLVYWMDPCSKMFIKIFITGSCSNLNILSSLSRLRNSTISIVHKEKKMKCYSILILYVGHVYVESTMKRALVLMLVGECGVCRIYDTFIA